MPSRTTATAEPVDARSLVDRARAAVPGYDATKAAEQAVKTRRDNLPRASADSGDVVDEIVSAAMAGTDLASLKLAERSATAEQAARAFHAEYEALGQAATRLVLERQHALADGVDDALTVIRAELDDVITEARRVADALDGINEAQGAIDAGRTAEWQQWGALATRYAEVRTAQVVIMSAASRVGDINAGDSRTDRDTRIQLDCYGHVRHPDAIAPLNEFHRAGRTRTAVLNDGQAVVSPPLPWLDPVPAGALEAVLTPGAEPWVPTAEELEDAREADLAAVPGPAPERKVAAHVVRAATAGMRGVDLDLDPR